MGNTSQGPGRQPASDGEGCAPEGRSNPLPSGLETDAKTAVCGALEQPSA